jgi:hypothetical protein
VRDEELDVLSDENDRLAQQVAATWRVVENQKAWCSANRLDVPSWVGTVEGALKL